MMELGYIESVDGANIKFTVSGANYMFKKHEKFMQLLCENHGKADGEPMGNNMKLADGEMDNTIKSADTSDSDHITQLGGASPMGHIMKLADIYKKQFNPVDLISEFRKNRELQQ